MSQSSPETLLVERVREGVVLVTLHRPERYNAMTRAMFDELSALTTRLRGDPSARVVVLAGAGRAFCAGYDLDRAREFAERSTAELLDLQDAGWRALDGLRSLPQPVIALVGGVAAGGGFSLALAADIRLASPAARFAAVFVRIGLSGGDLGASWLLPRLVGSGLAAELLYSGREVDAAEAERIGLVNRLVPAESLLDAGLGLAESIAAHPPLGVQLSKRALQANLDAPSFRAALELESRGQVALMREPATTAAVRAVRERQIATRAARDEG